MRNQKSEVRSQKSARIFLFVCSVCFVGQCASAQTNLPPPSISFSWQAALLVVFVLTVVSLWKNVFPKKQPPPEVDAALVETRLTNLEAKDQRDIDSRKTMHKEIADANKLMGDLKLVIELAKAQIPSLPQIRDEIDRSIRAGESRVATLQGSIDAYEQSRQADVRNHGERIAALESWRTSHMQEHTQ